MVKIKVNGEETELTLTPAGLLDAEKECDYNVTAIVSDPEKAMAGSVSFTDVMRTLYAGYKSTGGKLKYKEFCAGVELNLGELYDAFFGLLFPGLYKKLEETLTNDQSEAA